VSAAKARVEQTLTGLPVGGSIAYCNSCQEVLVEGDTVMAYAYRPVENESWQIASVYCGVCGHGCQQPPTVGCEEATVKGWLAMTEYATRQESKLTLSDLGVLRYSEPEGDGPAV